MKLTRPVLAMVHGWGMNARIFDGLSDRLALRFDVRALDLPGHGGRAPLAGNTLSSWADDLLRALPDGSALLGWSLGGQLAMRAALDQPDKLSRLILLATTPRFVAAPDWPHGMEMAALSAFGEALRADPHATLLRFLSLQTRGAPDQKSLLQALRQNLQTTAQPHADTLAAGLDILRDTDLRAELPALRLPTLVLHGTLDTLTPAGAGATLAERLPDARLHTFPRAAHAPHLSHPDAVAEAIEGFLHG
ncbi:MAG: pimeloyl-ACP methyl ester esterase BioH [Pseudomonadota bacterium]